MKTKYKVMKMVTRKTGRLKGWSCFEVNETQVIGLVFDDGRWLFDTKEEAQKALDDENEELGL